MVNLYCIVIFCTFSILHVFCVIFVRSSKSTDCSIKMDSFHHSQRRVIFTKLIIDFNGNISVRGRAAQDSFCHFLWNICIASQRSTMGVKRVENVCCVVYVYFCRSIFADKSPALITHSMPTNRVKTIDEKIVNRFSKFTVTLLSRGRRSARQLNIRRSRKNLWSLVERAYVDVSVSLLHFTKSIWSKCARPLNGIDMS